MDAIGEYSNAYQHLARIERRIQAMALDPSPITDQYEIGALAQLVGRIASKATTLAGLLEMRSEEVSRRAAVARRKS